MTVFGTAEYIKGVIRREFKELSVKTSGNFMVTELKNSAGDTVFCAVNIADPDTCGGKSRITLDFKGADISALIVNHKKQRTKKGVITLDLRGGEYAFALVKSLGGTYKEK